MLQRYEEYQPNKVQTVMTSPYFCCCTESCAARARLTLASVAIRCTRPQGWDVIQFIQCEYPPTKGNKVTCPSRWHHIYAITFEMSWVSAILCKNLQVLQSIYIVVSKQKMEIVEPICSSCPLSYTHLRRIEYTSDTCYNIVIWSMSYVYDHGLPWPPVRSYFGFRAPELRSSSSSSATSSFWDFNSIAAWALPLSSWYSAFWSLSCCENFVSSDWRRSLRSSIRDKSLNNEADVSFWAGETWLRAMRICRSSASVSCIKFFSSSSMHWSLWLSICSSSRSLSSLQGWHSSRTCSKKWWAWDECIVLTWYNTGPANGTATATSLVKLQRSINACRRIPKKILQKSSKICLQWFFGQSSSSCAKACHRRWPPISGWLRPSFSSVSRLDKMAANTGDVSPIAPS